LYAKDATMPPHADRPPNDSADSVAKPAWVLRSELPDDSAQLEALVKAAGVFCYALSSCVLSIMNYGAQQLAIIEPIHNLQAWNRADEAGDLAVMLQCSDRQREVVTGPQTVACRIPPPPLPEYIDFDALKKDGRLRAREAESDQASEELVVLSKGLQVPKNDAEVAEWQSTMRRSLHAHTRYWSVVDAVILEAVRNLHAIASRKLSKITSAPRVKRDEMNVNAREADQRFQDGPPLALDAAMLAPVELVKALGLSGAKTLAAKKRLERWRASNPAGVGRDWIEVQDRGPKDPQYLYRVDAVRALLADL
jgi:hypothetical protein